MAEPSASAYIETLFGGEDPLLVRIQEEAVGQDIPAIQLPFESARMLQLLIRLAQPKRILEVGTLFGYSSISMSRAMPKEARIVTLEVEPKHARVARQNFETAGISGRVEIREGNARESLESMAGDKFDLVFIDADKDSYPLYLDYALKMTLGGSLIVADNVWRNGDVVNPELRDEGTRGIVRYNELVAANPRLYSTIVPTRDAEDGLHVSLVVAE